MSSTRHWQCTEECTTEFCRVGYTILIYRSFCFFFYLSSRFPSEMGAHKILHQEHRKPPQATPCNYPKKIFFWVLFNQVVSRTVWWIHDDSLECSNFVLGWLLRLWISILKIISLNRLRASAVVGASSCVLSLDLHLRIYVCEASISTNCLTGLCRKNAGCNARTVLFPNFNRMVKLGQFKS